MLTNGTILGTDNVNGINTLKNSVSETQHSSEQEKALYEEIEKLIEEYISKRQLDSGTSDVIRIDKELLLQFQQDFKTLLDKYIETFGNVFDIETMMKNIVSEGNYNDNLMQDVYETIRLSLQDMIRDKIQGKIKNNIRIADITKIINDLDIQDLDDSSVKEIVDDILNGNSTEIRNAKEEFGQSVGKYRDELLSSIKSDLIDDLSRINYLNKRQETAPENKFRGIIDKTSVRYANIMVDSLILALNVGITRRIVQQTTGMLNFFISAPKKIVKSVYKFMKWMTSSVFSIVVGMVSNFILSPIKFILQKSFAIINGLTSKISKTLKFICDNTKIHYILMTPAGVYAIGFICGFIWNKLKKLMPELTFNIDGLMSFFSLLYNQAMELWDVVKEWWDDFNIKHSEFISSIKNIFNKSSEFINALFDGGLSKALNETEYGQNIRNSYDYIRNSWIWYVIKTVYKSLTKIVSFINEHPIFSGILFSAASLIKSANFLSGVIGKISAPIGGINGGLIPLLIGSASALVTEAAMEGVFRMFGFEYTETQIDFYDAQRGRYVSNREKMKNGLSMRNIERLSPQDRKRYEMLFSYIDKEYNDLDTYRMAIEKVRLIVKNGDSGIQRISDYMPNLVSLINSKAADERLKQKYNDAENAGDVNEQVGTLIEMLAVGQQNLARIQEQIINSPSSESLKKVIDVNFDKNGNVDIINNQKRLSSYIEKYKNRIEGAFTTDGFYGMKGIKDRIDDIFADDSLTTDEKSSVAKSILEELKIKRKWYNPLSYARAYDMEEHLKKLNVGDLETGSGGAFSGKVSAYEQYDKLMHDDGIKKLTDFFENENTTDAVKEKQIQMMVYHANEEQRNKLFELMEKSSGENGITKEDMKKMTELRSKILGQHFQPYRKQLSDSIEYLQKDNDKNIDNIQKIRDENEKELNNSEQNNLLNEDQRTKMIEYKERNNRLKPNK